MVAYGYQDPAEQFRNAVLHYKGLIAVAVEEGYTEDQAIELLKIYGIFNMDSSLSGISGRY